MVSLLCCCCRDIYIPNFLLTGKTPRLNSYSVYNNITYHEYVCELEAFVLNPLPLSFSSSYLQVLSVFYLNSSNASEWNTKKFPFSKRDFIEIRLLKPEFLGLDIGLYPNYNEKFDFFKFSWSDFTFEKIDFMLNVIMERYSPLFLPQYYYYSDNGLSLDDYAVNYTYDNFLVALRAWLYRLFYNFFKLGCIGDFYQFGTIYNKGKFRILKEPR